MSRSTNLLYNSYFHITESFSPSHFSNTIKGISHPISMKDNYATRKQVSEPFSASSVPIKRAPAAYITKFSHPLGPHNENKMLSKNTYTPFSPSSNLNRSHNNSITAPSLKIENDLLSYMDNTSTLDFNFQPIEEDFCVTKASKSSHFPVIASPQPYLSPSSHQNVFRTPSTSGSKLKLDHSILRYESDPSSTTIGSLYQHKLNPNSTYHSLDCSDSESQAAAHKHYSKGKDRSLNHSMTPGSHKLSLQSVGEERPDYQEMIEEEVRSNPKAEELLARIEKYELNPISLLNEVSGKLKKKIEYKISEGLGTGRTKTRFGCTCLLDSQAVGVRKGSSKQSAKEESAKYAIRTILVEDKYVSESAALLLSVQKATEKAKQERNEKANSVLSPAESVGDIDAEGKPVDKDNKVVTSNLQQEVVILENEQPLGDIELNNIIQSTRSPLSDLNNLAKKSGVEPMWSFQSDAKRDGEFLVKLQFGDLVVEEKGRKKHETKKEAALKMLEKIREVKQAPQTTTGKFGDTNRLLMPRQKNETGKRFFENSLKAGLLEKLRCEDTVPRSLAQSSVEQEDELVSMIRKYELDSMTTENLHIFFKKIIDYTSMITSNPKQIMLDAEKHLADYVKDCYLVPVGSFALGCMRNDMLIVDSLLTFEKVAEISDDELLCLYKHSLETCYCFDQQSGTNTINMNFQFNVKTDVGNENFMEIVETGKTEGKLKINIYVAGQSQQVLQENKEEPVNGSQDPSLLCIHQIYNYLNQSPEEVSLFRNILKAMRIWRRNAQLETIRAEIFDVVTLFMYMTQKSEKMFQNIINCMSILSSRELTKAVLRRFGPKYHKIYEDLSDDMKSRLEEVSRQSLKYIIQKDFLRAKVC